MFIQFPAVGANGIEACNVFILMNQTEKIPKMCTRNGRLIKVKQSKFPLKIYAQREKSKSNDSRSSAIVNA